MLIKKFQNPVFSGKLTDLGVFISYVGILSPYLFYMYRCAPGKFNCLFVNLSVALININTSVNVLIFLYFWT